VLDLASYLYSTISARRLGAESFKALRGVSAGRLSESAGLLYPIRGRNLNFKHASGVPVELDAPAKIGGKLI